MVAGAGKVIFIEPDATAFGFIRRNIELNNWENVTSMNKRFKPSQAAIPHDFMKMDCEGGEV